jgi:hypothetical protein
VIYSVTATSEAASQMAVAKRLTREDTRMPNPCCRLDSSRKASSSVLHSRSTLQSQCMCIGTGLL